MMPNNPYGFPQDSFNVMNAINPTGFYRPGVAPGVMGMQMSPTAAMGFGATHPAAAGMGMGMMGMGGFHRFGMPYMFGAPAQSEENLRAEWQRQTELIRNLAGQVNPATGRLYAQPELERMMSSLNAQTNRALQTMRQVHQAHPTPSSPPPLFGGSPGYFGTGPYGAYMPNIPVMPSSNRDLDERRNRVRDLQSRISAGVEASAPRVTYEQLQEQRRRMLAHAGETSVRNDANNEFVDPLTNRVVPFGSSWFGSGQLWDTDRFRKFRQEWDEYLRMHDAYRQTQQRANDPSTSPLHGYLADERRRLEADESEYADSRRRQRDLNERMQSRWMQHAFPTTSSSPAGSFGGAPHAPGFNSFAQNSGPLGAPAPTPGFTPPPNPNDMPKASSARVSPLTMDQLARMSGRGLVRDQIKRAAINPRTTAKIMAYLTGGGALAGGLSGAASAPYEYWPEAMLRGAGQGAATGFGAAMGGAAGKLLGKGLSAANVGVGGPRTGMTLGGLVGGATGALGASRNMPTAPWLTGEIPVLERLDQRARPKSPNPVFKTAAAKDMLKRVGLLSDRDAQHAQQDAAASSGMHTGLAGAYGAAAGAGAGGAIGSAAHLVRKGRPGLRGAAGKGMLAGAIPGLVAGSLVGAHNGYMQGAEAAKPTNTRLEKMFPRLNPV